jgi:hypothetical protein
MSTATELLRRALDALHFDLSAKESAKVAEEIRTFLAVEPEAPVECVHVPLTIWKHLKDGTITAEDLVDAVKKANAEERVEPKDDPVGYVYTDFESGIKQGAIDDHSLENGTPLYTRPEPARKPNSEEELNAIKKLAYQSGFADGIRFAEKHHGIHGED